MKRTWFLIAILVAPADRAAAQDVPATVTIRYGVLNTDCYPSCAHPTEWLQQLTAEVRDSSGAIMTTTGMIFNWGVDFCGGNGLQFNFATGIGLQQLAVDGNLVKNTPDCCPTCAHQAFRIGVRVTQGEETVTATPVPVPNIPFSHAILQNYPNPFNAGTRIPFELNERSHVRLEVVDLQGRIVERLVDRLFAPGRHAIDWTPRELSSGLYLARLNVTPPGRSSVSMTVKMLHGK